VRHIKTIADADFQKWDLVHVNLCGVSAPLIPRIKELIKGSSTILIVNQDYPAENFQEGFARPRDFYEAVKAADFLFCQTPWDTSFLNFLIKAHMPDRKADAAFVSHPVDMALKNYRVDYEERIDLIGCHFHRYRNELLIPSMVSWGLKYPTVLFGYVGGNIPVGLFHFTAPMMPWGKYFYVLAHCSLGFDYVSLYHCMGRFEMETASLGTPTVTTNHIYMGLKLFPMVCHDPTDFEGLRSSLQKLMDNEEFYHQVADYAYEHVEDFNWENSKKRLLEELEKRGFKVG
jgi:glycosyltransferase involved in cell wall biosynthesis